MGTGAVWCFTQDSHVELIAYFSGAGALLINFNADTKEVDGQPPRKLGAHTGFYGHSRLKRIDR